MLLTAGQFLCGISRCDIIAEVVVVVAMARLLALLTMSLTCASALPAAAPTNIPNWESSYVPKPHKRQHTMSVDFCQQVEQQLHMDLRKMTGWWYVVEAIGHRPEDRTSATGYTNLTICPTIHIKVDDEALRTILLTWEEPKGTLTYRFQTATPDDPGFWVSLGQQNGTYVSNPRLQYKQFAGSVQVLKAVATHLVLRFCSSQTHHYTIVMARHHNISQYIIDEVNNMVVRHRGLPLVDIRRACVGAAPDVIATLPLLVIAAHFVHFASLYFS